MDVSSKEFTLNFRGFEQDDPETVRKFTAFCEANFALSPGTFGEVHESADTVVLTHGESPEALEALAKVLREIGARVDVSQGFQVAENASLSGPSSQELHRLFGQQNDDSSSHSDGPSCPYPPLGRTLYLLTQSDGVFDRRRLRPKTYRSESREEQPLQKAERSNPRRYHAILVASAAILCVGSLALIAATFPVSKAPLSFDERAHRSLFQSRSNIGSTKGELPANDLPAARTLSANGRVQGFNIDLKVLASPRSLSISALTLIPSEEVDMHERAVIKKVVGDPTFLTESSPGEWSGRVQLSVFLDTEGQEYHVTIPAKISVKVRDDNTAGRAIIEVAKDALIGALDEHASLEAQATARLATFQVADLGLS